MNLHSDADWYLAAGIICLIVGVMTLVAVWAFDLLRNTDEEEEQRRRWYQEEINATIMLENEGVHIPGTFDGGAYLRELLSEYRQEGVWR